MNSHDDDASRTTVCSINASAPHAMPKLIISMRHHDDEAGRYTEICTNATAPDARAKLHISISDQERKNPRLSRALNAHIDESQDCANLLLKNTLTRSKYRFQRKDELEIDLTSCYGYNCTYHLQCTAPRTAKVDHGILTAAPMPPMLKTEC